MAIDCVLYLRMCQPKENFLPFKLLYSRHLICYSARKLATLTLSIAQPCPYSCRVVYWELKIHFCGLKVLSSPLGVTSFQAHLSYLLVSSCVFRV